MRMTAVFIVSALLAAAVGCGDAVSQVGAVPRARLAAPLYAHVGQSVVLDASAAYDPDGALVSYAFWAGDGAVLRTSGGPEVQHVFAAPGAYEAVVVVRDDSGQLARATQLVVVHDDASGCVADVDCPMGSECRADLHLCYAGGPGAGSGEAECDRDDDCGSGSGRCHAGLCLSGGVVR